MLEVKIGPFHPSLEEAFVAALRDLKADQPLRPVIVVAPSRWLLNRLKIIAAEQAKVGAAGRALLNVTFLTLYRFALRLISDPDSDAVAEDTTLVHEEVIRGILAQQPSDFPILTHLRDLPGLAGGLYQAIRDLRDADVAPVAPLEALGEGLLGPEIGETDPTRLAEVFRLYRDYHAAIARHGLRDRAAIFRLAAERADTARLLATSQALLLYGFYDLTGVQLNLVEAAGRVRPTTWFLPYRAGHPDYAFITPFYETHLHGGATRIEQLEAQPGPFEDADGAPERLQDRCRLLTTAGISDEVWATAKEILRLVEEEHIPFDEIGVVARSLTPYAEAVGRIFGEHQIPIVTNAEEPAGRYPLLRAAQQLCALRREAFARPIVMDLLNSPAFHLDRFGQAIGQHGLEPRPDLWDILSRRLAIRRDARVWLDRLGVAAAGVDVGAPPDRVGDEDGLKVPPEQAALLRTVIAALDADLAAIPDEATWTAFSDAFLRLIRTYLTIGDDPVSEAIVESLETLKAFDRLAPGAGPGVGLNDFTTALDRSLERRTLPLSPATGRGVSVLDAMAARGLPFRALFLLGMNEKTFPRAVQEEPFLRDRVRRAVTETLAPRLGQKLKGFDEERLLFALLLNAARERLYVFYQRADERGRVQAPSLYLEAFRRVLEPVAVPRGLQKRLDAQPIGLLTPSEAVIRLRLSGVSGADAGPGLSAFGRDVGLFAMADAALQAIEREGKLGAYDGVTGPLTDWWTTIQTQGVSPTTLESFGRCPFQFFAKRVLGLQPLEEPELVSEAERADVGTLYHLILERLYPRFRDAGVFASHDLGRASALLDEVATTCLAEFETGHAVGYPLLWEAKKQEVLSHLRRFVTWDLARLRRTGLTPAFFEIPTSCTVSGTTVGAAPGRGVRGIRLRGHPDRVDVRQEADRLAFAVVDYKSGRVPGWKEVAPQAVKGRALQPPLYLLLAEAFLRAEQAAGRLPSLPLKAEESALLYIAAEPENGEVPSRSVGGDFWPRHGPVVRKTLTTYLRTMARGLFFIHPKEGRGGHCTWCDFGAICRKAHLPTRLRAKRDPAGHAYRAIAEARRRES